MTSTGAMSHHMWLQQIRATHHVIGQTPTAPAEIAGPAAVVPTAPAPTNAPTVAAMPEVSCKHTHRADGRAARRACSVHQRNTSAARPPILATTVHRPAARPFSRPTTPLCLSTPTTQSSRVTLASMGEDEDTENTHTVGIVITVYNASGTEEKKIEAWVLGMNQTYVVLGSNGWRGSSVRRTGPWKGAAEGPGARHGPLKANAWVAPRRLLPASAAKRAAKLVSKRHTATHPSTHNAVREMDFYPCYTDSPSVVNLNDASKFAFKVGWPCVWPLTSVSPLSVR